MTSRGSLVAACAVGLVTGCGSPPTSSSGADLVVVADDIDYDADAYSVEAGDAEIELLQRGAMRHTLLIEDANGDDLGIRLEVETRGSSDIATVALDAGTYIVFCDISGHRRDGMVATLTVTDPST